MNAAVFIGLDLAWSERNRTGGAIIRDGALIAATGLLTGDDTIEAFVAAHLPDGADAVIDIDAPLRVPNQSGRRRADHEVSVAWRRFEAGAYPANRTLLAHNGVVRGEALVERLAHCFGFDEVAPVAQRARGRFVCEVFPHPAHVALFNLPTTLKYKRKPGRPRESITSEFARYQHLLGSLCAGDPPLGGLEALTAVDVSKLRGAALQAFEETLDAVTCAYVVYYAWWHGPTHQRVYGSIAEGHILTPCPPAMNQRLQE